MVLHDAAPRDSVLTSSRVLAARARIAPGPDAPYDRLQDGLVADLLARGPLARERFATQWGDTPALAALADAKRAPLEPGLARELVDMHRRLGASRASLANLDRLARGEAVAVVTGQQPAPLGGPLYALHKAASAIGLAAEARSRLGVPVVPLFWMHGEDSDFAEIRGATWSDAELQIHDATLGDEVTVPGGLVGAIAPDAVHAIAREALASWASLPCVGEAASAWQVTGNARDLGEIVSALYLSLFARHGLVVVDPRGTAFRAAARPFLERYLANADALGRAALRAGETLEARGMAPALGEAALASFVFEIRDGVRHKIAAAEARARGADVTLSPSVALRPAVQDGVLPTIGMAAGPGEIRYLAQLAEVFTGVGVRPAAVAPRFGATWLPPQALELLDAAGGDAWAVVAATDAAIGRIAETRVPAALGDTLARARAEANDALEAFAAEARDFDPSLPQMVESARGKADFQYARLAEGLLHKARGRLDREHPAWRRLRYVLMPGDKLQERRLASLEPVARRGLAAVDALGDLACEHAERLLQGVNEHWLLEA